MDRGDGSIPVKNGKPLADILHVKDKGDKQNK